MHMCLLSFLQTTTFDTNCFVRHRCSRQQSPLTHSQQDCSTSPPNCSCVSRSACPTTNITIPSTQTSTTPLRPLTTTTADSPTTAPTTTALTPSPMPVNTQSLHANITVIDSTAATLTVPSGSTADAATPASDTTPASTYLLNGRSTAVFCSAQQAARIIMLG